MTVRRILGTPHAALALACLAGVPAQADERFLLIDAGLRATPVSVGAIGPGGARISDEQGGARDVALSDIIALAPEWWRPGTDGAEAAWSSRPAPGRRSGAAGMILLTDGRRLAGRLASGTAGDRIAWEHPRLGSASFTLDDVRRVQLQAIPEGSRRAGAGDANDRVLMTNADAVAGFVESVGEVVKIESDGRVVELNLKQVALLELANPARVPSGVRLWLEDGSVLGAPALAAPAAAGEVAIERAEADAPLQIPVQQVMALAPDAARVVPLASLPIETQAGVGDRLYTDPVALRWRGERLAPAWRDAASSGDRLPPLDTPDIELPGPMSVEWTLPRGAARVAGWAEVPSEARLWAECTLVIEAVSTGGEAAELASESLSGSRPVAEFNLALPSPTPARLRVRIDAGGRGPIQDRVLLRRALVLVPPGAPQGP